jgi:hypothetical protein
MRKNIWKCEFLGGTCARCNYDNSRIRINSQRDIDEVLSSRYPLFVLCNCSVLFELCLAQVPKKTPKNCPFRKRKGSGLLIQNLIPYLTYIQPQIDQNASS